MSEPKHDGLPVAGYKPQADKAVAAVNINKAIEELTLRVLDKLKEDPEVDPRWLQAGRTQIEQGFMSVNRAIFKPDRVGDNKVNDGLEACAAFLAVEEDDMPSFLKRQG
jgi:hypothetical protein